MELAERYEAVMQQPASSQGLLSDQDLLAEVISTSFTLANHDFIAFPSWWVHYDIAHKRAQEVMEGNMYKNKKIKDWRMYGEALTTQIGAFHLSKSFDFYTNSESLEQKQQGWMRSMKWHERELEHKYIWPEGNRYETFSDYMEVLTGLWTDLIQKARDQRLELMDHIVKSVSHLQPGLGNMKALLSMLNAPPRVHGL